MNEDLPSLLGAIIHESGARLEEAGFTLEVFDSLGNSEKKSLGIYVEREGRGFSLTVWNSGEIQVSTINYETDPSPREKYLSDVYADQFKAEFEKLVDWVSRTAARTD